MIPQNETKKSSEEKISTIQKVLKGLRVYVFDPIKLTKKHSDYEHPLQKRVGTSRMCLEIFLIAIPAALYFVLGILKGLDEGLFIEEAALDAFWTNFLPVFTGLFVLKFVFGVFDFTSSMWRRRHIESLTAESIEPEWQRSQKMVVFSLVGAMRVPSYLCTPIILLFLGNLVAFAFTGGTFALYRIAQWYTFEIIAFWVWQGVYFFVYYWNREESTKAMAIFSLLMWLGIFGIIVGFSFRGNSMGPWYYWLSFILLYS